MSKEVLSLRVLSLIPGLIPGIEQVVLVHYQHNNTQSSGFLLKKDEKDYRIDQIKLEAGSSVFSDLGNSSQPYHWFQKNQLPFEIINKDKVQLTIFSELKNSVLLILYSISGSFSSDLFFIYFNDNLSNFLLDKVSEPFSAQHKNMVGFLLSHSINTLFHTSDAQNQLTATFDEQIRHIVRERDQLKEELEQQGQKVREGILSLAQYFLSRYAEKHGTRASLTDSAKIKLKMFTGELSQLEQIINDALEFAGALSSPAQFSQILLADYHIRFPDPVQQKISDQVIDGLPQRMIKTHLLLDRLELAASGIKQRKDNLTSANVGKEFPTPISAPAITDALRKHQKRIIQLFDQYPEKWEIIRHEFRPIQNLLNSSQNHQLLSA
ncbi:MAG: hypothetical protein IH596_07895 [Bacteroidales bacterium]|nr:hypothetical protein [Bacteroidales bacterium]